MSGSSGDVAALDRIATRVALTKEEELEAVREASTIAVYISAILDES